jgi:hypothetical protein
MRTFLVAALLAAAALLGPLAVPATAQESPCVPDSAYSPYEYGWYGHHHVDTYGGRPYYFHNPYGHNLHYRR